MARAGAEGTARRRRASPTCRGARPRTGTRTQFPVSQLGRAVAGTIVAPKPSRAIEVSRRTPSISASGASSMPARRRQQQAVLGQLGQGHFGAFGQRMGRGHEEEHLLLEDRLDDHLGLVDGQVDDGRIQLAGCQLGQQGGRRRLHDDGPYEGVGRPQRRQDLGHQPSGGGADDADASFAGDLLAPGGEVGVDGVELLLDGAGARRHQLALLGEAAS